MEALTSSVHQYVPFMDLSCRSNSFLLVAEIKQSRCLRVNFHQAESNSALNVAMCLCAGFDKQICNAVAVAYLLNATLVIPRFHLNSVWHDNR